jgi:hypothetical protein
VKIHSPTLEMIEDFVLKGESPRKFGQKTSLKLKLNNEQSFASLSKLAKKAPIPRLSRNAS